MRGKPVVDLDGCMTAGQCPNSTAIVRTNSAAPATEVPLSGSERHSSTDAINQSINAIHDKTDNSVSNYFFIRWIIRELASKSF